MNDVPLPVRLLVSLDRFIVRWTGWSLFMALFAAQKGLDKDPNFKPVPPLVLVTTGRKSGKKRSVVLPIFEIDGDHFVVGSKGGSVDDPFWLSNIRKNPRVTLFLKRRRYNLTGRVASVEERARLWPKLVSTTPVYAEYQRNTAREIPLVLFDFPKAHP